MNDYAFEDEPETEPKPKLNGHAQDHQVPSSAEAPWPAPLAEPAFHGLAGKIVRAIEPETEADPAAILFQFLAAFGNAVGPGPYVAVEGDRHPPRLFTVQVGKTSKGRKGTSWGRAREPLAAGPPLTGSSTASPRASPPARASFMRSATRPTRPWSTSAAGSRRRCASTLASATSACW